MIDTRIFQALLAATVIALPADLLAIDTDGDGLDDSVETSTGVYVSPTNTGTNPNKADSDGDGVGDWYEVYASFTDPNNPNDKPNIPYPLPAPDGSAGVANKPVKVYILSGQSNMVGMAEASPLGTAGTLSTITQNEHKFPDLLNGSNWSSRNDVIYRGVVGVTGNGPLTAGQGGTATTLGPELGFGHVMGYYHDEPVLLIKSCVGGRALGWDFLPPGSVQYTVGTTTYAGYGDSPASWTTGTTPVPDPLYYGGYQFDQCFLNKADWAPAGAALPAVFNVTDVLDNFASQYPQWASQGFQIAGFVWWQGWNDGMSYTSFYANRYEQNLAQFIRKIRQYYANRYPGKISPLAPFVLATSGFQGWTNPYPTRLAVCNAQLAVGDPVKYPEFAGNVKTMESRSYWRDASVSPANQEYHYNRNAETYMLVGDALGRGMIDLLSSINTNPDTAPPTPSPMTWATPLAALSSTAITMTATTASDPSGVQYYFANTTVTAGTHDSAWQDSPTFTDTGLAPSTGYTYTVKARDKSAAANPTAASTPAAATTAAAALLRVAAFDVNVNGTTPSPTQAGFAGMSSTVNGSQNGVALATTVVADGSTGYRDRGASNGGTTAPDLVRDLFFANSANQTTSPYPTITHTLTGLAPNTQYKITYWHYNGGAFQRTALFYETSVSGTLLATHLAATANTSDVSFYLTSNATGVIKFVQTSRDPGGYSCIFNGMTIDTVAPAGFAAWQAKNGTSQPLNLDHDNDGVPNGIEYFLGGPNGNTTGFTPLPAATNTAGQLGVTWTKAADYAGTYGSDYWVETCDTLVGPWIVAATSPTPNTPNTVSVTGNTVTYTFPAGTKNFARLKVSGP